MKRGSIAHQTCLAAMAYGAAGSYTECHAYPIQGTGGLPEQAATSKVSQNIIAHVQQVHETAQHYFFNSDQEYSAK